MSSKARSILSVVGFSLAAIALLVVALYGIVLSGFLNVEKQQGQRNAERVVEAYNAGLTTISEKLSDWAVWDDTYKYIQDLNPDYEKSNLVESSLKSFSIDLMIFIDASGKVVRTLGIEPESLLGRDLPPAMAPYFSAGSSLIDFGGPDESKMGTVLVGDKLMSFASHPIVTSEGKGPAMGVLVFGKYFDQKQLQDMSSLVKLNLEMRLWNDPAVPLDFVEAKNGLAVKNTLTFAKGPSILASFTRLDDYSGKPVAIIKGETGRDVYNQGLLSVGLGAALSLVAFLMIGIFFLRQTRAIRFASMMMTDPYNFKLAVENAGTAMIITDTDGKILFANKAVEAITGFSFPEIIGNTPRLWGKQMPSEFYKQMWYKIKNERVTFKSEIVNKRKNGEIYSSALSISPIVDKGGNLLGFVGQEEEITDKRRLEEASKRSEERFRLLIERSSDAIVTVTAAGEITYCNGAVESLLGYSPDEVVGKKVVDFVDPADVAKFSEAYMKLLSNPAQPVSTVGRLRSKNGDFVWITGSAKNDLASAAVAAIVINFRGLKREEVVDVEKKQRAKFPW